MAAIDLLFRTNLESERLHQIALAALLQHTNLPDLLAPGFGDSIETTWEPEGGTFDLSLRNEADRTMCIELKVDAGLPSHQVDKQLDRLPSGAHLTYVLLGHARICARPRLDRQLVSHGPKGRWSVVDLSDLRDALGRVETVADSSDTSDARALVSAYRPHLVALARRNEGFFDHPPHEWLGDRWGLAFGYFDHCRRTIPGMEDAGIAYVPNQAGGFRACYFHGVNAGSGVEAYLQLEEDRLCFKIYVDDGVDRSSTRDRVRQRLQEVADDLGLPIRKPARLGSGQTMTVAVLEADQTGFGLQAREGDFKRIVADAMAAVDRLGSG